MFPERFVKRIGTQRYIDAERLLKSLDEPSPVSIRVNTGKWRRAPLNSKPVHWCKTGFYLESRPSYTLDPLFHAGCYYPQEASGMFLEEVFNQLVKDNSGLRVLDLCGAPGGKSTHLASLIGGNGLLVSNEVIRSRSHLLAENITRWGVSNTIVTQNDPVAFRELPGFFDVILVDAPCSGEGMFRDPVARTQWSEQNTALCSERQKRIILDIWPALREAGILIYSTCTFNPAENEENIRWLVSKLDAGPLILGTDRFRNVSEIEYQGIKGYGFHPGRINGEGMFFSAFKKKDRSPGLPDTGRKESKLKPAKKELAEVVSVADFPEEKLVKIGDDIFGLPASIEDIQILFQKLRIIKAGTKIFTVKKLKLLPSNELAFSANLRDGAYQSSEFDLGQAITYLKRGVPEKTDNPKGWFIVRYKGVSLGFANNIGHRINNYYPVEWRIRMDIPDFRNIGLIKWQDRDL